MVKMRKIVSAAVVRAVHVAPKKTNYYYYYYYYYIYYYIYCIIISGASSTHIQATKDRYEFHLALWFAIIINGCFYFKFDPVLFQPLVDLWKSLMSIYLFIYLFFTFSMLFLWEIDHVCHPWNHSLISIFFFCSTSLFSSHQGRSTDIHDRYQFDNSLWHSCNLNFIINSVSSIRVTTDRY
jgi:hypothetical protein